MYFIPKNKTLQETPLPSLWMPHGKQNGCHYYKANEGFLHTGEAEDVTL